MYNKTKQGFAKFAKNIYNDNFPQKEVVKRINAEFEPWIYFARLNGYGAIVHYSIIAQSRPVLRRQALEGETL